MAAILSLLALFLCAMTQAAPPNKKPPAAVPPWPFDPPSLQVLRSSSKKVFAHYFPPIPISLDNKSPSQDYYNAHYLSPWGEGGKYFATGGYMRQRPLPQSPLKTSAWVMRNLEEEVRRAAALGLDGFVVDILQSGGPNWTRVNQLMEAAANVDPGFKIVLMPDMSAGFALYPDQLALSIWALSQYSSAYRLPDGRLVVTPYDTQAQSAEWWTNWLAQMEGVGIDVAFVPTFRGWQFYAGDFAPISDGFSDWGVRSAFANSGDRWLSMAEEAHKYVPIWMQTVSPQSMKPKNANYWEAVNSRNYRMMWMNAIGGGADWVQIATWNDYSEATEIAPSSGTQYAFYDLTAYFVTWFKTGQQPQIKRDVLYYFHRPHATSAAPNEAYQTAGPFQIQAGDTPSDEIELLAFLTEPGELEITVGTQTTRQAVDAGTQTLSAPLTEGRPRFRLLRNNKPVIDFESAVPISNTIVWQNLLYHAGGSSRPPVAKAEDFR